MPNFAFPAGAGGGGGGGGAPANAQYVTLVADPNLTQERVLTAGPGIAIVDGGAGGPVTISATVASAGWQDDGTVVRLITPTDQVVIGGVLPVSTEALRVVGQTRLVGSLRAGDLADTTPPFVTPNNWIHTSSVATALAFIPGMTIYYDLTPAANSASIFDGLSVEVRANGAINYTSGLRGGAYTTRVNSTGTVTAASGFINTVSVDTAATVTVATGTEGLILVNAGIVTTARSFTASGLFFGGTTTDWTGYFVPTPTVAGGILTNARGLHIQDITGATTINRAIETGLGLVVFGDDVVIGGTAMIGAERLRVVGDARVEGKLTVTGSLDPTDVVLSGGTALFFESNDGSTAAVSGAATGRIRYNNVTGAWELSAQGSSYTDIRGGWTDDGTNVRLTTVTDTVTIGTAVLSGAEKVRIVGLLRSEGRFDLIGPGVDNTFVGLNAGLALTTGVNNSALGSGALDAVTTGNDNTAVGKDALGATTTGFGNVAVGREALRDNTAGSDSTAVGNFALAANTTGVSNVALGQIALANNTTGNFNTAMGQFCLTANTTGSGNTAVGQGSLAANTTGASNSAIGREALRNNTTGNNNIAIGLNALFGSTTSGNNAAIGNFSLASLTTGNECVGVGNTALNADTTGARNTGVGAEVLSVSTTASDNTAVGRHAMIGTTTGGENTAIGSDAGTSNTTGTRNTFVGALAGSASSAALTNATALGYNAQVTQSNTVILGNGADVGIGTSTPTSKLHVVGAATLTSVLLSGGTSLFYESENGNTAGVSGAATGRLRYNNTTGTWQISTQGSAYVDMGTALVGGGWTDDGTNVRLTTVTDTVSIGAAAPVGAEKVRIVGLLRSEGRFDLIGPGVSNTFAGASAGLAISGSQNTAFGATALDAGVASGSDNTAVGFGALGTLNTGVRNTAVGSNAGGGINTSNDNVAVGESTMLAAIGSSNVGVGKSALGLSTANDNVAVGAFCMDAATTATRCVAVGKDAMGAVTTGNDNVAVGFQVLLVNTSGARNVGVGSTVLAANTIGTDNAVLGFEAMLSNTTGSGNIAIGTDALFSNTTGGDNIAIGLSALQDNLTSGDNIAIGPSALQIHTTGANNIAIGNSVMLSDVSGVSNVAIGASALASNVSGSDNVAIGASAGGGDTASFNTSVGSSALSGVSSGASNTALGRQALAILTTGSNNVAVGANALDSLTTASDNVAVGRSALATTNTGTLNVAVGHQALDVLGAASNNTAVGANALGATTTGASNTAVGNNAGITNTTGGTITCIGAGADVGAAGLTNATAVGANAVVNQNNALVLGNAADVGIGTSTPTAKLHVVGSTLIAHGTITTDIQTLSSTVTWNAGGVTFKAWRLNVTNTASAADSLLLDLQVGGTTVFSVDKDGDCLVTGKLTVTGAIDPPSVRLSSGTNLFFESANGNTAGVSAANEGRIRYNSTTQTWQMSTNGTAYTNIGASTGNTLDQAYDQGGPGAGRIITADSGAVEIQGASGLTVASAINVQQRLAFTDQVADPVAVGQLQRNGATLRWHDGSTVSTLARAQANESVSGLWTFTGNTTYSASATGLTMAGTLQFNDATTDPVSAGQLRRNGLNLRLHNGSSVGTVLADNHNATITGNWSFSNQTNFTNTVVSVVFDGTATWSNAGTDPVSGGQVRRNGVALRYHNGSSIGTLLTDAAQTITSLWSFTGAGASLTIGDELQFNNAAAGATTTGRLRRNAGNLTWHDGSAARTLMNLEAAQTITGVKTISAAFSYTDGVKQTFNPDATNAGVNVGSQAGDPSTLANGDLWYNSTTNALRARINGVSQTIAPPGWRFISKTTVGVATQTVTLSSLDGNTDIVYMVVIRFKGTGGTASRLDVRPNGVTTNLSGAVYHSDGTTFTQLGLGTEIPIVGTITEPIVTAEVLFYCSTGQIRVITSRYTGGNAGGSATFVGQGGGRWDETATNITSLVFRTASGSDIQPGSEFEIYALRQA